MARYIHPVTPIKPQPWNVNPAAVSPEWAEFWESAYACWPLWEGQGNKIWSIGKRQVETTFTNSAVWATGRTGWAADFSAAANAVLATPSADEELFDFTNDFTVTVVFFDPGDFDGNFFGKSIDSFSFFLSVEHGAQQFRMRKNTSSGFVDLLGPGGVGGLNFLHNQTSIMSAVYSSTRGMELWHNGALLLSDSALTDDVLLNNNGFGIGARGSDGTSNANYAVDALYFHDTDISPGLIYKLSRDPYGPFRMEQDAGAVWGGVQVAVPVADVSLGGWEPEEAGSPSPTGSPTELYPMIDEVSADDADWIQSSLTPSNDTCEVRLASLGDPQTNTNHVVKYRYQKSDAGGRMDLTVALMEGATERASWTHMDIGSSWVTASQTLSGAEADSISDYTNLRLRFTADQP